MIGLNPRSWSSLCNQRIYLIKWLANQSSYILRRPQKFEKTFYFIWRLTYFVTSDPLNFVVNTVVIQYCVYYKIWWISLYLDISHKISTLIAIFHTNNMFKIPTFSSVINSRQMCKVHIFWEGDKILRNLHLTFSVYMNFNPARTLDVLVY